MGEYTARSVWQRGPDEAFTDKRYSRRHRVLFDGGAELAGSSSPQVVPLPYSDAAAVDPEEMLVAALSTCHMLWFLDLASRRGWCVDRYDDSAVGRMAKGADGRIAMQLVVLHPLVDFGGDNVPDQTAVEALHHEAHEACFIANSVKTEVRCEPRWS